MSIQIVFSHKKLASCLTMVILRFILKVSYRAIQASTSFSFLFCNIYIYISLSSFIWIQFDFQNVQFVGSVHLRISWVFEKIIWMLTDGPLNFEVDPIVLLHTINLNWCVGVRESSGTKKKYFICSTIYYKFIFNHAVKI